MKGYASIELVVTLSLLLLLFSACFWVVFSRVAQTQELRLLTEARTLCRNLASVINLAAISGDGYVVEFRLPAKLADLHDYNITPLHGLGHISVSWEGGSQESRIVVSDVSLQCLDKGLHFRNRALNDFGTIFLICHRPELVAAKNSFAPQHVPVNVSTNFSFVVANVGPVRAENVNVSLVITNGTHPILNRTFLIPSLKPDSYKVLTFRANFSRPGRYPVNVTVDPLYLINESVEWNNELCNYQHGYCLPVRIDVY